MVRMIRLQLLFVMRSIIILLVCLLGLASAAKWAVLVAGSNTYSNYRHQADIYHAYQTLIKSGMSPDNIITMAYDDIVNHKSNPFQGKVFNKPTYQEPGVDVYDGVKIDYKGSDVNPTNFMSVLNGQRSSLKGVGSGRVLESTAEDNVFIYFSDHGGVGLIAFPSKYLYADQLLQTLASMRGKYAKLVFYLETCESGSMFVKLPTDTKIYALSAANPHESSWGTYCSPQDVVQGKHIGSCLGDLFSVVFLEDLDKGNSRSTSLTDHFQIVKKLTTKSNVMQWGDLSFQADMIGDYTAGDRDGLWMSLISRIKPIFKLHSRQPKNFMDSRTMKLQQLAAIYARQHTPETLIEMQDEMHSMQKLDKTFANIAMGLKLKGEYDVHNIHFDCMRDVMESYEQKCGRLSDYGLIYTKYFAEACEANSSTKIMASVHC